MDEQALYRVNAAILATLAEGATFQSLLDEIDQVSGIGVSIISLDGGPLLRSAGFAAPADAPDLRRLAVAQVFSGEGPWVALREQDRCWTVCPIRAGGALTGASILSHSPGREETAQALGEIVSRFYGYFFQSSGSGQFNFQTHMAARALLREGDSRDLRFVPLGASFHPGFASAVFRARSQQREPLQEGALQALPRYQPQSFSLRDGDRLLALLYALTPDALRPGGVLYSSLDAFCQQAELVCTVSQPFETLENRFSYLHQATALMDFAPPAAPARIVLAGERYTDLVLCGAAARVGLSVLQLSDIERLARHDRENQTAYLETLENYLNCANRFTQASKNLFIDRGTLKYRLEKIKKLLTCDPEEPAAANRLRLAIRLYRLKSSQE